MYVIETSCYGTVSYCPVLAIVFLTSEIYASLAQYRILSTGIVYRRDTTLPYFCKVLPLSWHWCLITVSITCSLPGSAFLVHCLRLAFFSHSWLRAVLPYFLHVFLVNLHTVFLVPLTLVWAHHLQCLRWNSSHCWWIPLACAYQEVSGGVLWVVVSHPIASSASPPLLPSTPVVMMEFITSLMDSTCLCLPGSERRCFVGLWCLIQSFLLLLHLCYQVLYSWFAASAALVMLMVLGVLDFVKWGWWCGCGW